MLNLITLLKPFSKYILIGLVSISIIVGSFAKGYSVGKHKQINIYNAEKVKVDALLLEKNKDNVELQNRINSLVEDNNSKLLGVKSKYEKDISSIKQSYSSELLQSKERSNLYLKYYSKDDQQCSNERQLAEYTARLDNSLTEGRQLVKEFSTTLRYRDEQVKGLNVDDNLSKELLNGTK